MTSSDERREVARKLRDCIFYAKGHDLNGDYDTWGDKCVETRCTLYNDIAACIEECGNVSLSAEDVFTRLADLIDPTCEVDWSVINGYHDDVAKFEHMLSCGHKALTFDSDPPAHCPVCGARVVSEHE